MITKKKFNMFLFFGCYIAGIYGFAIKNFIFGLMLLTYAGFISASVQRDDLEERIDKLEKQVEDNIV